MTWDDYLDTFHHARPGITEAVLHCARDTEGIDPYQWLAAAAPAHGRILDLACGSAPMHAVLPPTAQYIGTDRAAAELGAAQAAGALPLLRADATALPLAAGTIDTVVCSMALMLFTPLPLALAEIRRILRPGGLLVATVPASSPMRLRDRAEAGALLLALGRRLHYPNDQILGHLPTALTQASNSSPMSATASPSSFAHHPTRGYSWTRSTCQGSTPPDTTARSQPSGLWRR